MKISYAQHILRTSLLVGLATALLATSATAETVSFSDTELVGAAETNFYLGKFDTGLGTLTGVEIKVDFSTLAGSLTYDAMPEPATWALLALVGTFFVVTRHRKLNG